MQDMHILGEEMKQSWLFLVIALYMFSNLHATSKPSAVPKLTSLEQSEIAKTSAEVSSKVDEILKETQNELSKDILRYKKTVNDRRKRDAS